MSKNIIYLIILVSIIGIVWSWNNREKLFSNINTSLSVECTADQRNADFCIEIYKPVCATVNIQCIKAPCDPIKETFANFCKACSNSIVSSYIEGECEVEKTTEKSHKDISYNIEGESFLLKDGYSEETVLLNSASKIITRYFGNEAVGDLNGDGKEDVAFLLTQETGGSGVFYYVVVALKTNTGYKGTNAIFLGDRIAPQTTEIKDGVLIVNYADRNIDDPMTTQPSVGKTLYAIVKENSLEKIKSISEREQILWGKIIMGHETRVFKPCSFEANEYWILGNSPVYSEMLSAYQDWVETQENPYEPLFVVISGEITDAPTDGFGADYDNGFNAKQIIKIIPNGICK